MSFHCRYELDQRPDVELANLFQESYRLIQDFASAVGGLAFDSDGLPDPSKYVLLYHAALMHGAADAALTLTLHNLGREARYHGRQLFEYWVRASHYVNNPTEAKAMLLSTPFREREILDELRYDRNTDRYRDLQAACGYVTTHFPGFVVHREPSFRSLAVTNNDSNMTALYAFFYRVPSQAVHATGAGLGNVMRFDGLAFDSREPNPNISLSYDTWVVQHFLALMNGTLNLGRDEKVNDLSSRSESVRCRLGENFNDSVAASS